VDASNANDRSTRDISTATSSKPNTSKPNTSKPNTSKIARPTIAVLGGGQLGWMLGLAGIPLGARFRFLDPSPDAPAAAVGDLVVGALDDEAALRAVADGADVVTFEWEGVPAESARLLARDHPVRPGDRSLEVAQDRLTEKDTFRRLGIATPEYRPVDSRAALDDAVAAIGVPAVLKTRRGGYDGKGQAVLRSPDDVGPAWDELGSVPLILESFVAFDRELSIVAVRGLDGTIATWPVVENEHRDGVLHLTRAPAPHLDPATARAAEALVTQVLTELDHIGVIAIELFDVDGALLANELAPRVHNSGHWTIEGAVTSQFENHVRAVLGLPLGDTSAVGEVAMRNYLGSMPDAASVLAVTGAHLHDYAKTPRAGRKVGHVTIVATTGDDLDARLAHLHDE
jgi:5-(carboxyamino)imidazole ribonucleotide synthase